MQAALHSAYFTSASKIQIALMIPISLDLQPCDEQIHHSGSIELWHCL